MKHQIKINFIIDILLFLNMAAIGGIGFLIKYTLVSGSERWKIYGSNVELLLWGWDRHQWGRLHLALGYICFGFLFLHILFHWKQIKCMFKNLISSKCARVILTTVFVSFSLWMLIFAFIVPFDMVPQKKGGGQHGMGITHPEKTEKEDQQIYKGSTVKDENGSMSDVHKGQSVEIHGSSTLREIAVQYCVPADSIKMFLGIPLNISDNERLGRLRRTYDFHMHDVDWFIEGYQNRIKYLD